jgi:1-acyl-sn-glycerol-3-phosphate acyltransferase
MSQEDATPAITPWLHRWFGGYSRRYLRKNFNSLRILNAPSVPVLSGEPAVFYFNHASWWDPLVALYLNAKFYPKYSAFGPIDASALRQYPFLRRLGFFPLERDTLAGARQFIRDVRAIFRGRDHCIWLAPQGRFCDVRERPVMFEKGLGHLAHFESAPLLIPVAIEYTWWFERAPEILVAIGKPLLAGKGESAEQVTRRCETGLTALQDELAAASLRRDPDQFTTLLEGRKGIGGVYDVWRRWKASLQGKSFSPSHHQP